MGAWGSAPEECDKADDWLIGLWEKTKVFEHLSTTIELNAESHHEEIRMAIKMAVELEPYGLIETSGREGFLKAAVTQLRIIMKHDVYQTEEFQTLIAEDLKLLENM